MHDDSPYFSAYAWSQAGFVSRTATRVAAVWSAVFVLGGPGMAEEKFGDFGSPAFKSCLEAEKRDVFAGLVGSDLEIVAERIPSPPDIEIVGWSTSVTTKKDGDPSTRPPEHFYVIHRQSVLAVISTAASGPPPLSAIFERGLIDKVVARIP